MLRKLALATAIVLVGSTAPPRALLGTTFAAGDPQALASAVRDAVRCPDAQQIAAAANASRRYDWSVVGAAICEVYHATVDPLASRTAESKTAQVARSN